MDLIWDENEKKKTAHTIHIAVESRETPVW